MIEQIISGGQTGVDRAALDAARSLRITIGGWCPKHGWAEDGPIPDHYPLKQTPSEEVSQRTAWNVQDSDGTLLFSPTPLQGGTQYTHQMTKHHQKPCLLIDSEAENLINDHKSIDDWIQEYRIHTLNVAGPRESEVPGIYQKCRTFLLSYLKNSPLITKP